MCGITGWVGFDTDLTGRREVLAAMTATMTARGPDAGDLWVSRHAGLGHRRLAVIDPVGGAQPMVCETADGPVVLAYSGETYNHAELRRELVALGYRFRTASDTEVVLTGYRAWGDAVAERLNGMYAFAIWDGRVDRLVLVRDRMGVKPLYLHRTKDGVLFGSEPKAVLANPLFRRRVTTEGLRELAGFTKASGWALWEDLAEVEPGTIVTVDRGGVRERSYWRLRAHPHTDDARTTVETVGGLLADIIRRQVVSDVPWCTLLSGGLDSSAVTALAADEAADGEKVRSYAVDFTGYEETFRPDELRSTPDSPFVREVVAHVGTLHSDILLDPRQLADPALRRAVVAARDLPIGLGDIDMSMLLLFRAIRAEATVALSGEFADEVFGGYPWFHHPAALAAETFPWLAFQNSYTADRGLPLRPGLRRALQLDSYVADQYDEAVAQVDPLDGEDAGAHQMRTASHLHVTRLARALLDRKDRLSMAAGLEVRVPFADHRLVEYVHNVPWALKTIDGRPKGLLCAAVAHRLPRSVVERVKSPYPSSQDEHYVIALQQQTRQLLSDPGSAVLEVFDPGWLRVAATGPAVAVTGAVRTGLERALDFEQWIDLYQPDLVLDHKDS
ncbi:asparagine synthase (glutamine-hydrolyzing) [Kribbella sp. NPDC056861]|uniref:asparagine synthase (glutamine-hydrolyzing) n=1 Tax=Kribbella sp. NPDC056861 TaxID=3154857 RepID=UPI00341FA822